jgi:hypothetical protein
MFSNEFDPDYYVTLSAKNLRHVSQNPQQQMEEIIITTSFSKINLLFGKLQLINYFCGVQKK